MRILFLTHYFPPEVNAPASRTFEHCREWQRMGHDVTVVTCVPNHPTGKVRAGYRNRLWQRDNVKGIEVIRIWTFLAANRGVARRTLSFLSYLVAAIAAIPFLSRADVVISTSPQFFCGLAGLFVARAKRAKWALEIRDIWPESISGVGAISNRGAIRALEALERWAYRNADLVVPVTHSIGRHIEAKGVPRARIRVVMNGVDLEQFRAPRRDPELARSLGLEGKFIAGYLGTHGMAHALETVLDAAARLKDDRRIAFLLVGDGAMRGRLLEQRERQGLNNVVMIEQQPRERMPAFWGLCDAALVLLRRSPVLTTALPSKVLEAMAMRRPIIVAAAGEAEDLVEAAVAGLAVTPEDPQGLADAVRTLADDPALQATFGERGHAWVERNHDRRHLARRLLAAIEEVCFPGPGRALSRDAAAPLPAGPGRGHEAGQEGGSLSD
jgi:glycosyltransferase involved in cell wall biosynthesis